MPTEELVCGLSGSAGREWGVSRLSFQSSVLGQG